LFCRPEGDRVNDSKQPCQEQGKAWWSALGRGETRDGMDGKRIVIRNKVSKVTEPGGPKTRELACTPATANEKKRTVDEDS
jgi:hypothetical protein